MQSVNIRGKSTSKGYLDIACDNDGNLIAQLEGATVNVGDVDIASLPSGNLGTQAKAASLSVNPASDIPDATYIGDIKFGESLPAGTALLGKVGIDQSTANANEVVVKSITSGPLPDTSASDLSHIHSNSDTIAGDLGATTDAAASVSEDETATARSLIALAKAQKNLTIDLSGFLSSLDGKLAILIDSQAPVVAGSRNKSTAITFTGIGTYSAYDVVGALVELPNFASANGRGGVIRELGIRAYKKSMTCQFRVHFFKANDPTLAADNAQWKELWADRAKWGGWVDLPALSTAADTGNSDCSRCISDNYGTGLSKFIACAAGTTSIWAALEIITPGATAFDSSPGNSIELRVNWEQL